MIDMTSKHTFGKRVQLVVLQRRLVVLGEMPRKEIECVQSDASDLHHDNRRVSHTMSVR